MIFEEKTIESEMIYKGKILNLRRDKVTVKDGKTSYREIIEHNGAVVMIPITNDNKIVLVRQFRKPLEKAILEVPAGKIEKDEKPLLAAERELREETGYTAGKMELLTKMYPSVGYSQETFHMYMCTELTPGETEFDEHEAIEIEEYSIEDAYKMAVNGKIEDGKTLVAILLAWHKMGK